MTEHDDDLAPHDEQELQVDFEPEEEFGDLGAAKAKLKKLKEELEKAKKERQEYLDGWQRCKADAVNSKQESARATARSAEMLREALVQDLIPVLDSFDMAAGSDAWAEVSDGFRTGMENVRMQLLNVLESHGIKRFGKVAELFDPRLHEIAQEMDGPGEPHAILKILRYGYSAGDRVLRPAHVITKK
jgi:molecular chaperone GrpE